MLNLWKKAKTIHDKGKKMNRSIDYYNNRAQEFYDRTIDADLSASYEIFLKHLPEHAHILDAGCGVGRDSKYFLERGYSVTAFDASEEMVNFARKETGLDVQLLTFQNMTFDSLFDGVWAQATLLHVPYEETPSVFEKIRQSLKPGGIFFGSYKYGSDLMPTEERDFWNMDESSILPYVEGLFDVINVWTEKDRRSKIAPSLSQQWLNFLVKKPLA